MASFPATTAVKVHMAIRNSALSMIAIGVMVFVFGVYGITRQYSVFVIGFGIILAIVGASTLLWVSRPWHLSVPHFLVVAITVGGIVLCSFEHFYKSDGYPPFGYLLWAIMPYIFCLILSSFSSIQAAVIAGAAFAFAFDLWGYYVVFINPQSSTAGLVLLFIPLWNTIILIPLATFITWSIGRIRRPKRVAP